jgi:hypothetical protein
MVLSTSVTPSFLKYVLNVMLVTSIFIVVDLLFHFVLWPVPEPYGASFVNKFIFLLLLAVLYVPFYKNLSGYWPKIGASGMVNGIFFNLMLLGILFLAIMFMEFIISFFYVDLLQGIRGVPPPPDTRQAAETGTQLVMAGISLSGTGKTEDNPK